MSFPAGTVTLLLGDVEGSTRLWEEDPETATTAMAELDDEVTEVVASHAGVRPLEQGEGDSFVAAFGRASDAVAAALELQRRLDGSAVKVRAGIHTGEVQLRGDANYIGTTVNRAARVRDVGHGGQILLSRATFDLVRDRLPDGATALELGIHRLKDLGRPEELYQLCHPELGRDFPPLRSLDMVRHNLPVQLSSFIGREAELAVLQKVVAERRVVTLTGSGGVGKTRLALELAARLVDEFPDGVFWVDLAALTDPAMVPAAIVTALEVSETPGRSLVDTIAAHLRSSRVLLVLDNCEHVVDVCAEVASTLGSRCATLQLLCTSREPLGIAGEATWPVPALAVPEERAHHRIPTLTTYEAVQLFIDRAKKARPNFTVTDRNAAAVAQICQRLDGIPLAIELAAARTRVLTPGQILAGLEDRFRLLAGGARVLAARQQTLAASVDWSYDLLDEAERRVFHRLGVFAGWFDLDAAEAVTATSDQDRMRVLDLVTALVDKSLVVVNEDETRHGYRLLETIRSYARTRLAEAGELEEVRARHLEHYVAVAERLERDFYGHAQDAAADAVEHVLPNFVAAFDWARDHERDDALSRLSRALFYFWLIRGRISEGVAWCETAVARAASDGARLRAAADLAHMLIYAHRFDAIPELLSDAAGSEDDRTRGRALAALGSVTSYVDFQAGATMLQEAATLAAQTGDTFSAGEALVNDALARWHTGELLRMRDTLQQAVSLTTAIGDAFESRQAEMVLGLPLAYLGEVAAADTLLTRVVDDCRRHRDTTNLVGALASLGFTKLMRGDLDASRSLTAEALEAGREFAVVWISYAYITQMALDAACGDAAAVAQVAAEFDVVAGEMSLPPMHRALQGEAEAYRGDFESARRHLEAFLRSPAPIAGHQPFALRTLALVEYGEGNLDAAERAALAALELAAARQLAWVVVDSLERLGDVEFAAADPEKAARLYGAAAGLREDIDYAVFPIRRQTHAATLAGLRAALGDEGFERSFAAGRALSRQDAVAYAQRGRGPRRRPTSGWESLSPTEAQVVALVAEGLSNPQIGERLFMSRKTVATHLTHIYAKVGVTNRSELAVAATRRHRG